jgi:hypothetical protein
LNWINVWVVEAQVKPAKTKLLLSTSTLDAIDSSLKLPQAHDEGRGVVVELSCKHVNIHVIGAYGI